MKEGKIEVLALELEPEEAIGTMGALNDSEWRADYGRRRPYEMCVCDGFVADGLRQAFTSVYCVVLEGVLKLHCLRAAC